MKEKKVIIQGNLNPVDLVNGGPMLQKKTLEILDKFKDIDHIFNLSHGILPETPIENVEKIINIVKNYEFT